jgi:hypothetical protein
MENNNQQYSPGNEPVSVDDLIFQIGEKELDLYRKRKAIDKLTKQIQMLLKKNEELKLKLLEFEKDDLEES